MLNFLEILMKFLTILYLQNDQKKYLCFDNNLEIRDQRFFY